MMLSAGASYAMLLNASFEQHSHTAPARVRAAEEMHLMMKKKALVPSKNRIHSTYSIARAVLPRSSV
jgi:hypothetical protein